MARFTYNKETGRITDENGLFVDTVRDSHGYRQFLEEDGKYVPASRKAWQLVTGKWPAHEIDHRNRVVDDNRWDNLREATKSQNAQNRAVHKNNRLGVRGVRRLGDKCFEPRLMINGKAIYLGTFRTLEEAVAARKAAEKEHFTHG